MVFMMEKKHMSLVMVKPAFCICENKDTDQLLSNCAADQRLCFHYTDIVQSFYYLNSKFQASNQPLRLYSPVCVGPGRKPEGRFSYNEAHITYTYLGGPVAKGLH